MSINAIQMKKTPNSKVVKFPIIMILESCSNPPETAVNLHDNNLEGNILACNHIECLLSDLLTDWPVLAGARDIAKSRHDQS